MKKPTILAKLFNFCLKLISSPKNSKNTFKAVKEEVAKNAESMPGRAASTINAAEATASKVKGTVQKKKPLSQKDKR